MRLERAEAIESAKHAAEMHFENFLKAKALYSPKQALAGQFGYRRGQFCQCQ